MKRKTIAIIPARAGSKRLIGKNFRKFCGKPLIEWTVIAAKKSLIFDEILVSTDCPNIIAYYKNDPEIKLLLRPKHLSSDHAKSQDVVLHCLKQFNENHLDVCLLQPTSPLRNYEDIIEAKKIFSNSNNDTFSATKLTEKPTQWIICKKPDGYNKNFASAIEHSVIPNGAIYWYKCANGTIDFDAQTASIYLMPIFRSTDIDTSIDFSVAQAVMSEILGFSS